MVSTLLTRSFEPHCMPFHSTPNARISSSFLPETMIRTTQRLKSSSFSTTARRQLRCSIRVELLDAHVKPTWQLNAWLAAFYFFTLNLKKSFLCSVSRPPPIRTVVLFIVAIKGLYLLPSSGEAIFTHLRRSSSKSSNSIGNSPS